MTIAEKITRAKNDLDEVYTAGYEKGKAEVIPSGDYSEGFTAGKKAEYDAFWGTYQDNGNRTMYVNGFGGSGWTNETFNPPFDMYPTSAYMMFRYCEVTGDLVEILSRLGRTLDFSNCTGMQYTFNITKFTRVGVIDCTAISGTLDNTFASSQNLETIDKLILKNDGSTAFGNTFGTCKSLKNITIEGTIGKSVSFKDSPLTADSAISVINHLKSFHGASDAYSQTLTFSTSTWDALGALGAAAPDNTTWRYYVEQELAWNT